MLKMYDVKNVPQDSIGDIIKRIIEKEQNHILMASVMYNKDTDIIKIVLDVENEGKGQFKWKGDE